MQASWQSLCALVWSSCRVIGSVPRSNSISHTHTSGQGVMNLFGVACRAFKAGKGNVASRWKYRGKHCPQVSVLGLRLPGFVCNASKTTFGGGKDDLSKQCMP